ncbi:ATP-binding protein [Actinocorallia populi]|uniref:ATP-binding protein n=1 Tax=Actinocorallia populi TaxID=2079200 RepID=UPI0018E541CB|nr:LuxR C-terminal-related transcriptional regulator [Actinocorallia populi]
MGDHPVEVSAREAEVLALLGLRLANAQIAGRLHVSVRTVEGHVSSLLRKYGVAGRSELAGLAGTVGDGAPPPQGRPAGLPKARTSFIGRAAEREAVLSALRDGRLVTLLGPGGVGKTRLAMAVGEEVGPLFPFGGAFVDLAPVDSGFVARAAAEALGVSERPRQPLEETIAERLARGRSLLILDNCEHLLDAAAGFAERILSACPASTILATSRERLGLPGEQVLHVGPLPLGSDAERLFTDRALAADPDHAADPAVVADLCARLDGLPLAIELAAARSASLGASGLLTALGDYLRLLAGGRGPAVRHRSLRRVIGWSHDLLDEEERTLWRRLAAFTGSFDLTAVSAVCDVTPAAGADILGRLVDKSLVMHRRGPVSRWRMLATIRACAAERLELSGERAEVRHRHLVWAADTAAALEDPEDDRWCEDFDTVAAELRAALAAAPPGPHPVSYRLARSLSRLSYARRFLEESQGHYQRAAGYAPTASAAADAWRSAADCAQVMHDTGRAFESRLASAAAARTAGDGDAQAIALARAAELAGRFPATFRAEIPRDRLGELLEEAAGAGSPADPAVAAHLACAAAWNAGPHKLAPDPVLGARAVEAARATADPVLISGALDALRTAAATSGRLRDAHRLSGERLALLPRMDADDPYSAPEIDDVYGGACADAVAAGDLPAATATAHRLLADGLLGGHPYLSAAKVIPALVLTGDLPEALRYAITMWDSWQRAGRPPAFGLSAAVHFTSLAYGLLGDRELSERWRTRVDAGVGTRNPFQDQLTPLACFTDARIAVHTGDLSDAAGLLERAFRHVPGARYEPYAHAAAVELAAMAGLPEAEKQLPALEADAEQNDWAGACLERVKWRIHGDGAALEASIQSWERLGARFEHARTLLLRPDVAESAASLR